jgi:hypothetical protein
MRLIFIVGLVISATGCSFFKPKIEVPTVEVPVAMPCLSKRPVVPAMKFDSLPVAKTESESAEHVRILWLDRQSLLTHSVEWDVAASGCEVISK